MLDAPCDLEQAKRLLAEAGYAGGGPDIELTYPCQAQGEDSIPEQLLQAQLKRAGACHGSHD